MINQEFVFVPGKGLVPVAGADDDTVGGLNPSQTTDDEFNRLGLMRLDGAREWGRGGGIDLDDIVIPNPLPNAPAGMLYLPPGERILKWNFSPIGYCRWALITIRVQLWEFTDTGENIFLNEILADNYPARLTEMEGGNTDAITGASDFGYDVNAIIGESEGLIAHGISQNNPLQCELEAWPNESGLIVVRASASVVTPPTGIDEELSQIFISMQKGRTKLQAQL